MRRWLTYKLGLHNLSRTLAEKLFEQYCQEKAISCFRVPESEARTPDYRLAIGEKLVFVEVKEIRPTAEERESDRLLKTRGYGNALGNTPGDRVRKKIKASSGQLRAKTSGQHPSILVLGYFGTWGHLDPYHIRVGMYGLEQVHLAVPPLGMGSPYRTGMSYGPKRKMTQEHNTSISAIGTLLIPGPDLLQFQVYHNRFAEVPLDPSLLARYEITQLELDYEAPGATAEWGEVVLSDEP